MEWTNIIGEVICLNEYTLAYPINTISESIFKLDLAIKIHESKKSVSSPNFDKIFILSDF